MISQIMDCTANRHVLVCDLDGTLYTSTGSITNNAIKVIKSFLRNNGIFIIATGRHYNEVKNLLKVFDYNKNFYLITSDGQYVYNNLAMIIYKSDYLSKMICFDIKNFLSGYRSIMFVHDNFDILVYPNQLQKILAIAYCYIKGKTTTRKRNFLYVDEVKQDILGKIEKIRIYKSKRWNEFENNVLQKIEIYTMTYKDYIDIYSMQTTKANALTYILEMLMLPINNVVVIGNDDNDLSLFAMISNSYCVANGSITALKTAKYTVPDNDNNGVIEAILRAKLIM